MSDTVDEGGGGATTLKIDGSYVAAAAGGGGGAWSDGGQSASTAITLPVSFTLTLTASPATAVLSLAGLTTFGSVDGVQPDSLAVDFERISVNDRGDAGNLRFGVRGRSHR